MMDVGAINRVGSIRVSRSHILTFKSMMKMINSTTHPTTPRRDSGVATTLVNSAISILTMLVGESISP